MFLSSENKEQRLWWLVFGTAYNTASPTSKVSPRERGVRCSRRTGGGQGRRGARAAGARLLPPGGTCSSKDPSKEADSASGWPCDGPCRMTSFRQPARDVTGGNSPALQRVFRPGFSGPSGKEDQEGAPRCPPVRLTIPSRPRRLDALSMG